MLVCSQRRIRSESSMHPPVTSCHTLGVDGRSRTLPFLVNESPLQQITTNVIFLQVCDDLCFKKSLEDVLLFSDISQSQHCLQYNTAEMGATRLGSFCITHSNELVQKNPLHSDVVRKHVIWWCQTWSCFQIKMIAHLCVHLVSFFTKGGILRITLWFKPTTVYQFGSYDPCMNISWNKLSHQMCYNLYFRKIHLMNFMPCPQVYVGTKDV